MIIFWRWWKPYFPAWSLDENSASHSFCLLRCPKPHLFFSERSDTHVLALGTKVKRLFWDRCPIYVSIFISYRIMHDSRWPCSLWMSTGPDLIPQAKTITHPRFKDHTERSGQVNLNAPCQILLPVDQKWAMENKIQMTLFYLMHGWPFCSPTGSKHKAVDSDSSTNIASGGDHENH